MNIYPIWARISSSASLRVSMLFERVFFPSCFSASDFHPREAGDYGFISSSPDLSV